MPSFVPIYIYYEPLGHLCLWYALLSPYDACIVICCLPIITKASTNMSNKNSSYYYSMICEVGTTHDVVSFLGEKK